MPWATGVPSETLFTGSPPVIREPHRRLQLTDASKTGSDRAYDVRAKKVSHPFRVMDTNFWATLLFETMQNVMPKLRCLNKE